MEKEAIKNCVSLTSSDYSRCIAIASIAVRNKSIENLQNIGNNSNSNNNERNKEDLSNLFHDIDADYESPFLLHSSTEWFFNRIKLVVF